MAYNNEDKLAFALKDAKYSISAGQGNSMTNAINWAIAKNLTLDEALEASDKIFHYSQVKIGQYYQEWLSLNEKQLRLDLGIDTPIIDVSEVEI